MTLILLDPENIDVLEVQRVAPGLAKKAVHVLVQV